jgi:dihydrofolate synthase/folylpolyglutamate synthase
LTESELARRISLRSGARVTTAGSVAAGCEQALAASGTHDRILVFGSFHTVGPALVHLGLGA